MKVFLSWSGTLSHKVALVLREWLPSVIQAVAPYVSSEDIDKGTRWSTDIAQELEASSFGIICVTKENLEAPWVHFEAGALSKSIDKSNVSPLLVDVKRSEVQGPLLQFQSTILEKEDMLKLLKAINARLEEKERLRNEQLEKALTVWWSDLDRQIKEIRAASDSEMAKGKPGRTGQSDILEELLELARQQQRLLSNPEKVLPIDYLDHAMRRIDRRHRERREGSELVHDRLMRLEAALRPLAEKSPELASYYVEAEKLHREFHHASDADVNQRRRLLRNADAIERKAL